MFITDYLEEFGDRFETNGILPRMKKPNTLMEIYI